MVKSLNLDIGNESNIWLIGDFHVGSKNFDKKALIKTVKLIEKDKKAKVFVVGDLCEFILPNDKRFDISNIDPKNTTSERQYNTIKTILYPIRKKVQGILMGNHDFTLKSKTGFDIPHILSHDLNAFYFGGSGIVKMSNGLTMFIAHGCGTSTTLGGQVNKILKLANNFKRKPDIVAMGHVHALQVINNASLKEDFTNSVDYLALTGSYYRTYIAGEDNYGTRNLYNSLPCGCVKFNIKKNGKIKGETIIL